MFDTDGKFCEALSMILVEMLIDFTLLRKNCYSGGELIRARAFNVLAVGVAFLLANLDLEESLLDSDDVRESVENIIKYLLNDEHEHTFDKNMFNAYAGALQGVLDMA